MTEPPGEDPGTLARLRLVATWDGTLVHGAQRTLADVHDRLSTWRARLEGVGRALGEAECWSGPAADAAAATVVDLSRVAAAVQSAFGRSQEGWDVLSAHAGTAQELAEQALVLRALAEAGTGGWPLPGTSPRAGGPAAALMAGAVPWSDPLLPATSVADDALSRAAAAGAAARAAADGVAGLTGFDPGAAAPMVPDLLARLGPLQVPAVPDGLPAADAAAWWASLSAGAQEMLVATAPAAVGSLDGVPAWARDRANRLVLQRALGDPALPGDARRTARLLTVRIEAEEAAGRTVQVHLLDLAGGRVVLAFGDLDTADSVALLVPGVRTTPDDDLRALVGDAHAVAVAATAAAPAVTVATVVWLGYRTPQTLPSMIARTTARQGGRALAAALDGLAGARTAVGSRPPRTIVLAHSYGTVVVDEGADLPGRLAADAVVLLGSPGMEDDAASLEAPEVYDAWAAGDPISWAGWFGLPPGADAYGSTGLPSDAWAGHSDYYDPDGPTLAALGEVVVGRWDRD